MAATYLFHVNPNHLGLRLELYSDIPGDPTKQRLPKLPAGLVGAPLDYSISEMVLPAVKNPNETWVVWVQVGWLDNEGLEYRILDGDFPPVARSWPPLKYEKFMLVDARTGTLDASGIHSLAWELSKPVPDHPVFLFGDTAQRAAQERADHWFGKVRSEQARRSGKRER